jgi:hypothetical protein
VPDPQAPRGAEAAPPAPTGPVAQPDGDDRTLLIVTSSVVLLALAALLGWTWLWTATTQGLFGDVVRGGAAGAVGALVGWLAADRGRWQGWGAVVVALGASLPAAAAMLLLTRRVDPALSDAGGPEWVIAPLLFVVVVVRSARPGPGPSDRIPADAWLAAAVAVAVVVAGSFGILNTVARPATAVELVCTRFEDWSAARATTSGGTAEIVRREEFFTAAIEVVPTPESIDRVNRMLELSYRIEAAMSPGGGPSQAAELERTLRAEMADWHTSVCAAPS